MSENYKLYIIDYWVPFPSSEYGGIIIITAKSEEDAIEVIKNHNWKHWDVSIDNDILKIEEAVKESIRYEIHGDFTSKVVKEFLT